MEGIEPLTKLNTEHCKKGGTWEGVVMLDET